MLTLFRRCLLGQAATKNPRVVGYAIRRSALIRVALRSVKMILVLFTLCVLFQPRANPQVKEVKRVLVFYELGLSSPAVTLIDHEMLATLEDSRYQIELYREHLETTLFDDAAAQESLRQWYIHKYQDHIPDLIIALGPSPLHFMVDAHEIFFSGIPIVFGGTSEPQADNPTLDSHFTGCWESFEPAKTLDVALRLQPGTNHVVVVGGILSYDKHLEAIYREQLHGYESSLEFTYLTDLDMPSLLERLKRLPPHTIVLYTHIGMDAKGTKYVSASQAGPMVAGAANAPVFGPSDVDLGHGQVGGYLQSFAMEGKIIGGIAVRILNGVRPQDVPIVRGTNAYMFDWRALRRWGFNENDLPTGSVVLFRSPSFWQRTKWMWVAASLATLFLGLCGFYLRFSWRQLKLAKDRQLGLSGMLITAQEKERSRLASEIHDDFSQRLALLALGLENAEESIGTSPGEAVQQVHDLLNSASEIGADLHTLSHRLHSSTLEALGLVPGLSALCKEFGSQQRIEVDFLPEDIPRSVHPDVALCLFRIVQEGLRNLKKHSGATKAQVRLRRSGNKLVVSVNDEGFGFDARELGKKEGLGIRSMEERVYLLGGRFEIRSRPGRGTKVEAWVPIQPKSERAAG
ncbi:MAG TPA: ATP-binding protein [Terriglobales bacterium]|nr:ATP-binding protein [Terriglobales bacterium]